ncbi:VID27-domain-containing protein [Tilletiaria anomala UBC 951]|uniref:VID27-domain-containing protein n=1 Tax=Tilletiaria anomala (strain ATCC 24038 / CBS 436.72 / UBC 951) TaxID=1037660 RepID=A0A066WLV4_TILAU|nr:VID27-domain-containing protein [Tilletiaria anomala UBC 951]KDN51969.1 VID27-domain-containing protein [Tilletiaria anomala UBC 951]
MFMLKSLFGKIWGDANNAELMQLPSGSLYLVRPGSIKGSRECIYKDAVATIRRTTTEHNYQLVITRAYEEGEEQLLEEDEENDDERSFLIDEALEFRASTTTAEQGQISDAHSTKDADAESAAPTFVWRDVGNGSHGDEDDLLEFVIDSTQVNAVTRSIFEVTFLQCIFERKYGRSHEEATDEDLEKLKYKPPAPARAYPDLPQELSNAPVIDEKKETQTPTAPTGAAAIVSAAATAEKGNGKGKAKARSKPQVPAEPSKDAMPPSFPGESAETVSLSAVADLYLYDEATGLFMNQQKNAQAKVIHAGQFLYWLTVSGPERHWLSQRVGAEMNINFALDNLSAVWNYFTEGPSRDCYSWLLRFYKREDYESFQSGFSRCLWETLNEESWGKMKENEKKYLLQAYEEDVEMTPVEQEEEEAAEKERRADRLVHAQDDDDEADSSRVEATLEGVPEGDEEDEYYDDEVEKQLGDAPEGMPDDGSVRDLNSQLAVGYKNDRTFVVRGNRIGVFRHTDDDKLEFATTINKVCTPKGKTFNPKKVMLHNEDTAMVMMDPSNQHSLFKMDLEYGKIVEEWNVHEDVGVSNVLPSSKYAQMSAEQTLIGTSHNSVYRIDPRLSGQKLVDSQFKQYTIKAEFSAAATDKQGRLAVASKKGDIRLFDKIGKNAKTALPALGDPILGVDVTSDGRYVLATCKTYLLLIDTLIGDGKNKGSLGFDRSFPAESKPIPRRLQLKPHHVAYMDEEVTFTPARFDVGEDNETSIVTSSGPFVVNWSFEAVKKGKLGEYQIRRYADRVVQDEYGYNSRNIIVALPHDVTTAKRSNLKKPTRASLSTTPRGSKS